ncbi:sugar ABC transporter ATP-binding protein [Vibrio nigripulchritudo]|uniref:sugar ABC transporter ATP-binding protein n=1 Tax=Vibrio nigripulchritudo TaxID=28173 RepID=UPI0024901812|nr:sugar ABC transporter ATP-binding protein [Vibrio nigripulchritudo]BDU41011.1 ribose ABC transporter ATP-binding protein [Vibrio nigripulchritudo]BDU46751.1 ribose ABC transporter ATP-binding protein [Vibrio nigripulchritudo]
MERSSEKQGEPNGSAARHSAPETKPILRFKGISIRFGGVQALDEVDFEVGAGEVHCLAGENGCGKSTIIKVITGVYQSDSNTVMELAGKRFTKITPQIARAQGIAVIWQDLALFSELTVAENIAIESSLGMSPRWVNHSKLADVATQALQKLGVELDLNLPVKALPIAQRQIVAIARALISDAKVVFMDEPTASLTQAETDYLLEVVRKLSASGVSVVFVSHRLVEVLDISDRVTVLRDGKLVGVYDTDNMTQSRLTELMTGKSFTSSVSAVDTHSLPVVLQTENLTRNREFHRVSLTVREGEVVGLIGLIGAGRTELGKTLFGMSKPDSGAIRMHDKPVIFHSNRDAIDAGIAYLSEDRLSLGLIQEQPIADNIALPVLSKLLASTGLISANKKSELVTHWIKELAVKIGQPEDAIATLSGGNQQRIAIAKWLVTEPKLLILDSPTVGVDVGARAGIFEIVRKLAKQGLGILLISDEIQEVYFNADRVLHMADGHIVGEYDPRQLELKALEEVVYV